MVTKIMNWFDDRLPLTATIERHLTKYPAPINMNIWYLAGVLLVVVLVIQLASGIWLLMNYEPTAEGAFASIQYIMRDVEYGYIIRYMHTTGASAFFCFDILAYVQRHDVRLLSKTKRATMGSGMDHLPSSMYAWLYGLRFAMGPNVLLGCTSNNVFIWFNPVHW